MTLAYHSLVLVLVLHLYYTICACVLYIDIHVVYLLHVLELQVHLIVLKTPIKTECWRMEEEMVMRMHQPAVLMRSTEAQANLQCPAVDNLQRHTLINQPDC